MPYVKLTEFGDSFQIWVRNETNSKIQITSKMTLTSRYKMSNRPQLPSQWILRRRYVTRRRYRIRISEGNWRSKPCRVKSCSMRVAFDFDRFRFCLQQRCVVFHIQFFYFLNSKIYIIRDPEKKFQDFQKMPYLPYY